MKKNSQGSCYRQQINISATKASTIDSRLNTGNLSLIPPEIFQKGEEKEFLKYRNDKKKKKG